MNGLTCLMLAQMRRLILIVKTDSLPVCAALSASWDFAMFLFLLYKQLGCRRATWTSPFLLWPLGRLKYSDCRSFTSCQGKAPVKAEIGLTTARVTAPVIASAFQAGEKGIGHNHTSFCFHQQTATLLLYCLWPFISVTGEHWTLKVLLVLYYGFQADPTLGLFLNDRTPATPLSTGHNSLGNSAVIMACSLY